MVSPRHAALISRLQPPFFVGTGTSANHPSEVIPTSKGWGAQESGDRPDRSLDSERSHDIENGGEAVWDLEFFSTLFQLNRTLSKARLTENRRWEKIR